MTREVKTCSGRDFLSKAARVMWHNDCGCVPIIDTTGNVVGMITDRDIAMAAYMQGLPLHSIRVESAMVRMVITCSADDDLETVEELMRQNQIRRVPVLDQAGKLIGIVSLNDLTLAAHRQRERETTEITAADISETLRAICRPHAHFSPQISFAPEPGEMKFVPSPPPKRGPWRR